MKQFICPTCGKSFKEKLFFETHAGLAHDDSFGTQTEVSEAEEVPEDLFTVPAFK